MERRMMDGREMRTLEMMTALADRLERGGDTLRERLRGVPHGWRQYRLLCSTLMRLLTALYDTMPTKNLVYLHNIELHGEVLIRFKPVVRTPENVMVRDDDLREILNVAMAAECAVCLKEGKEIDRCRLRQAAMCLAPPYEESRCGCGYRDVALRADYGEYVKL